MSQLSSRFARALAASFVLTAVIAACGSEGGSNFDDNTGKDGGPNGTSSGVNNGSSGIIGGGSSGDGGTSGTSGDGGSSNGDIDPSCKGLTCAAQNIQCGLAGDGCGRQIDCGGCKDNERCGAVGKPSQCVTIEVATTCTPKTCADLNVTCGQAGDGCGNLLNCGTCAADEQCGAVGRPSQCVKVIASEADGGACVPLTKADYAADNKDCGTQSNGCGGTIDLGTCTKLGEFCGGGGPSKCDVAGGGGCLGTAKEKKCSDYPADVCGPQPNGCGGVTASCGAACVAPQVCGGGGIPSHCGGGTLTDDAGNACVPKKCLPSQCGTISDGCGAVIDCGNAACTGGTLCGGAGTPNQCGKPACTAKTKAVACNGLNCGSVGDGCGGVIDCYATGTTSCTAPAICGGGGKPNVCGGGTVTTDGDAGSPACVPKTVANCAAGDCGPIANGCGGTYTCGTAPSYCPAGQSCGLGGTSKCGTSACVPRTQDQACGAKADPNRLNCGVVADGCGNTINCWRDRNGDYAPAATACPNPGASPTFNNGDTCGGGGTPNKCGGGVACTGTYCGQQPTCTAAQNGGNGSTITGNVWAPNGTLPIHDAVVYIPNAKLADVPVGVSGCDACLPPSGSPFVSTRTSTSGAFRLDNVPVPASGKVTLVIQKGRWRKVLQDISVTACGNVNLSKADGSFGATQTDTVGNAAATHIPSNNIPKFAVTSGGADAIQCLVRRIGIDDSEFGNPGSVKASTGLQRRVNVFHGDTNNTGATSRYRYNFNGFTSSTDRTFPEETTGLYGSTSSTDTSKLRGYDGIVLTCTGVGDSNNGKPYDGYYDDMQDFVDKGGKVFASHWHHTWLHRGPAPWNTVASFTDVGADTSGNTVQAYVNQGTPKGIDIAAWLNAARGGGTLGQLGVIGSAQTIGAPLVSGTSLITRGTNNSGSIQYADFLMPPNATAANKCGRFVMSDLHVTAATSDTVGNGNQNRCIAGSAANLGNACSSNGNCGGGGNCAGSGGGFPDNCQTSTTLTDQEKILAYMLFDLTSCIDQTPPPATCTKKTCADYTACGVQSDGCGGLTNFCNPCTGTTSCGGGGVAGVCGTNTCTKKTCPAGTCSTNGVPDGCGGLAQCQPCAVPGDTCGGGGTAGVCGQPKCTKLTCAQAGAGFCGQTGDGCGGVLTCNCTAPQVCGGGGSPNKCGTCTPITTCPNGLECGQWPNGCGGSITCGTCPNGESCGGGGQANVCGVGTCVAKSCAQLGAECGSVSDGCGGITKCNDCAAGDFCNASNLCVPPTCQPKTCAQLGVDCGPVSDGCGGLAKNAAGVAGDCGTCAAGKACGANGTPGICSTVACTPSTCNQLQAECGAVADGCGGLAKNSSGVAGNCGSCPGTKSCVNGACVNACTPRDCNAAGAECGFVGDGCGGAIDCGSCSAGKTCGFGGLANKCGAEGPK